MVAPPMFQPAVGAPAPRAPLVLTALVGLALGLWAWTGQHGWMFADAVEYLERARAFVRGEALIDAQAIRPMGVSLLYVPLFALAEWTGQSDAGWIAPVARWIAVLVAVATALAAAVLAGRVTRNATVAVACAGLAVATNPVLLRFVAVPLADSAAALCVTLGLIALVPRAGVAPVRAVARPFRQGLVVGAAAGAALLSAYKTVPLVGLLGAAVALDAGLRARPRVGFYRAIRATHLAGLGFAVALGGAVLVQCALDARTYGGFGAGIGTYLAFNLGPMLGKLLYYGGLTELGARLYQWGASFGGLVQLEHVSRQVADIRGLRSDLWYVTHFTQFVPAPLTALGVVGLGAVALGAVARRAVERRPGALMALGLALAYGALTSIKGDKDFRLWLPILPVCALLVGIGAEVVAGAAQGAWARQRAALVAALVVTAGGASMIAQASFLRAGAKPFAAFAEAAEWVEGNLAQGAERVALASSWHWAVLLETGPRTTLTKLPKQLDGWATLDGAQRAACLAELERQDVFVTHHALLTSHLDLCAWIAERFSVAAGFWHPLAAPGIGPVLVLVRDGRVGATPRRLVARSTPTLDDPVASASGLALGRDDLEPRERLTLLGARLASLPGGGVGWLETTWRADVGPIAGGEVGARTGGYLLRTRLADPEGRWAVDGWRPFGRGIAPSGSWPPGSVIVDGWVLDPWRGPLEGAVEGLAPAGARAAELWLDVASREGARVTGRLTPTEVSAPEATPEVRPKGWPGDWQVAPDGSWRAARLALPSATGEVVELRLAP